MNAENLEKNKDLERITDFWKRVNHLLKEKGFTQESFSRACLFSPNKINNWTNRKTLPDAFETQTIAKKLGVSMDFLVSGEEYSQVEDVKEQIKDLLYSIEAKLNASL